MRNYQKSDESVIKFPFALSSPEKPKSNDKNNYNARNTVPDALNKFKNPIKQIYFEFLSLNYSVSNEIISLVI